MYKGEREASGFTGWELGVKVLVEVVSQISQGEEEKIKKLDSRRQTVKIASSKDRSSSSSGKARQCIKDKIGRGKERKQRKSKTDDTSGKQEEKTHKRKKTQENENARQTDLKAESRAEQEDISR
ncbi:hypothetical protein TRV_03397 [Trichophyton verrucosum HKI 0517]|uniref:Uncharacterized protein n=1 Tax=Trichophyton verrucosum (strain HKI 0517) TaxID=663202 RepID=D4D8G1_TRIVH|nr:uncharacterized protein TRV_03397 [Trichophyton verrucosum HKI 0517]EFE41829.1 hypothetical protein TRV_03397 [Trichophyton verrucosum HKI 0517]